MSNIFNVIFKIKTILRIVVFSFFFLIGISPVLADFGSSHSVANDYSTVTSSYCSMSSSGRFTVFQSNSTNLIPGVNGAGVYEIFLYDRAMSTLSIVSRTASPGNALADNTCDRPVISRDGRYVAFESLATNLSGSDNDGFTDIFLRDRKLSTIALASSDSSSQGGNGHSSAADISADGRYVTFQSTATNLSSPCYVTNIVQIFQKDMSTGAISCVSSNNGIASDADSNNGAPGSTPDGRYVVFATTATNLGAGGRGVQADVYLWDKNDSHLELISVPPSGNAFADALAAGPGSISDDGRYVVFIAPDNTGSAQIYRRDRQSPGATTIVSRSTLGGTGNGPSRGAKIDASGRYVVFFSESSNFDAAAPFGGLFFKDMVGGSLKLLEADVPSSTLPCMTSDANAVTYSVLPVNWNLLEREQDQCPADAAKENPGLCGCGVVDNFTDTDGDDVVDCADLCPSDPTKEAPGACGCGKSDADTDGDGKADCIDECPSDSSKQSKGFCGCGIAETDTDSDGVPDCIDECSSDADKKEKGQCGCGKKDDDSDKDGISDCVDLCPNDSKKRGPGTCGCGTSDDDSNKNGIIDCLLDLEIKERIVTTSKTVGKIKYANNAKTQKQMKGYVKTIKSLMAELKGLSSKGVSVVSGVNFQKEFSKTSKVVKQALNYKDPNVKTKVKAAKKSLSALNKKVVVKPVG